MHTVDWNQSSTPLGLVPDTVSLLTADPVTRTCCPGEHRCPETYEDSNFRHTYLCFKNIISSSLSGLSLYSTAQPSASCILLTHYINEPVRFRAQCYLVICSKVVNLLLEHTGPEVFTDELHDVQLVFEPCRVFCQSMEKQQQMKSVWLFTALSPMCQFISQCSPIS